MSQKKPENPVKKTDSPEQSDVLRRFKQHPLIFIGTVFVLIIVIVAFVLVPAIVPGEGIEASKLNFGSWDNKPIAYSAGGFFSRMVERYSRYQMGDFQSWRMAFENTVLRVAALDTMDKSGYQPSKAFVDRTVARMPEFQENGRFSAVKYDRMDAASRIRLWQDVRDDLTLARYAGDVSEIKTSSGEADFIGSMALVQRKFKMTVFPYSSYPDSEIAAYAGGNPDMFKTLFISQITIDGGEREAQAVLDKIRSNETSFEDAARTQSSDNYADRGGDAGARMVFELSTMIADEEQRKTLINLAKDEVSSVLKLPSGWAIFRANDAARSADLLDSATLDKIRSFLMENERGVIEDWLIREAENFALRARMNGFEIAAGALGMEIYEFGAVPINYGDNTLFSTVGSFQAPGLQEAAGDENFWRAAFGTPAGEPSGPIILAGSSDSIVVLYPEEEALNDTSAAENSKNAFSGEWAESVTQRSINNSIFSSKKFKDDFYSTYFSLLSN